MTEVGFKVYHEDEECPWGCGHTVREHVSGTDWDSPLAGCFCECDWTPRKGLARNVELLLKAGSVVPPQVLLQHQDRLVLRVAGYDILVKVERFVPPGWKPGDPQNKG